MAGADDSILVVAAPALDSEPTAPQSDLPTYFAPWVDDADESEEVQPSLPAPRSSGPPRLPKRRTSHRMSMSTSPEEDGHRLPSEQTPAT